MCMDNRDLKIECLMPLIGGPCPCSIPHTHCINNKCICGKSFIPFSSLPNNAGEQKCIKRKYIIQIYATFK